MKKIKIDKLNIIGKVERQVWGSFIEQMGRAVYGGIYDGNHFTADEEGFRGDVIQTVKEMGVPIIRYPGGNIVSGYNWKNGIGKNRPVTLDLAWKQTEPNTFGLHEFCSWAEKVGAEVMMAVNMGTGTPKEAAELVEYCNHPGGTYYSDLRRENGVEKPFAIKKWCIGNEMDGEWQICALTAEEYAKKALESAKMMKLVDSKIELVVCGSANRASYPLWDRVILEKTYNYADYISVHRYYSYPNQNPFDFMSSHTDLNEFLQGYKATADYVKALLRSNKTMMFSVDEWNIWHTEPTTVCKNTYNDSTENCWEIGPRRVENIYDLQDAIAFTGLICTLINNADRVKMGCLAQLINVIAPIMTDEKTVVKQTTFYPYLSALNFAEGDALNIKIPCEKRATIYGESGELYGACCFKDGVYTLWVINKTDKKQEYEIEFENEEVCLLGKWQMSGDLHGFNDFSHPDDVALERVEEECMEKEKTVKTTFSPYSFTLLRFKE